MHRLTAADGHRFGAYHAFPREGVRRAGGLVVLQEIFGLTDYIQSVCDHWASLGFEVLAPALFDRVSAGAVIPYDQIEAGRALANQCILDNVLCDIDACIHDLRERQETVSILGFCWGGGLAFAAACSLKLDAAVCVYPTRMPDYLDRKPSCPVQIHVGTQDTHIPAYTLAQITTALPGADIHLYNAGHGFDRMDGMDDGSYAREELRENILEFLISSARG